MGAANLCYGCMEEKGSKLRCSHCGYLQGSGPESSQHLPPGNVLINKYMIGRVLGQGGFGITYLAYDFKLDIKLAIKEFFPQGLASRVTDCAEILTNNGDAKVQYEYGLERFLNEAKTLARFIEHPSIVSVRDYFEANGTAYMVMNYVEGVTLEEYLIEKGSKINMPTAINIIMQVLDALKEVHKAGILHRDISPDNLYIDNTGRVKVIDFGAARQELQQQSRSLSLIMKIGYSPIEQYQGVERQGPRTDIYAVAATLYRSITGQKPPSVMDRVTEDTLIPPSSLGCEISAHQEKVLLKALSLNANDRYRNTDEFQEALNTRSPNVNSKGKPAIFSNQTGLSESNDMHNKDFAKINSTKSNVESTSNRKKKVIVSTVLVTFAVIVLFVSLLWGEFGSFGLFRTNSTTINVPGDFITIQAAITSAEDGYEIVVSEGRYLENIDFAGKNIILRSTNPTNPGVVRNTIIDGKGHGTVVSFTNGEGENTILSGFLVTNGSGILVTNGGSPLVENCIIEDNKAEFGGGIAIFDSAPSIIGNTITNNNAFLGGGLYVEEASPLIKDNNISNNKSEMGGGLVIISNSSPLIVNNSITDNFATRRGGGIVIVLGSEPEIRKNTIKRNVADRNGGGILIEESTPVLEGNSLSENSAVNGGAIFIVDTQSSKLLIKGNSMLRNLATIAGGAIYIEGSSPTIESNSFTSNRSDYLGGGIALYNSAPIIHDNKFTANEAKGLAGGAIWFSIDSKPRFNSPDNNSYDLNSPDNIAVE